MIDRRSFLAGGLVAAAGAVVATQLPSPRKASEPWHHVQFVGNDLYVDGSIAHRGPGTVVCEGNVQLDGPHGFWVQGSVRVGAPVSRSTTRFSPPSGREV